MKAFSKIPILTTILALLLAPSIAQISVAQDWEAPASKAASSAVAAAPNEKYAEQLRQEMYNEAGGEACFKYKQLLSRMTSHSVSVSVTGAEEGSASANTLVAQSTASTAEQNELADQVVAAGKECRAKQPPTGGGPRDVVCEAAWQQIKTAADWAQYHCNNARSWCVHLKQCARFACLAAETPSCRNFPRTDDMTCTRSGASCTSSAACEEGMACLKDIGVQPQNETDCDSRCACRAAWLLSPANSPLLPSNWCTGQKRNLDAFDNLCADWRAKVVNAIGVYNRQDCPALTPADLASLPCEARADCAERWKTANPNATPPAPNECIWKKCTPVNAPEFDPADPAPAPTPTPTPRR